MPLRSPLTTVPLRSTKKSLGSAIFFETLALLAVTVIASGIAAFFLARAELKSNTMSALQSAMYSRENLLETTIARQRMQVSILAKNTTVARIPSVTSLVGFRKLLRIHRDGIVTSITGETQNSLAIDAKILQEINESDHAAFRAIFSKQGWAAYIISAPETNATGARIGTLVALFDPTDLTTRLLDTEFVGQSAEVLLAIVQDSSVTLLHSDGHGMAVPVETDERAKRSIFQRASTEAQGVEDTIDYSGISVLSAYRSMPSIGWLMIVNLDTYEITTPILRLAMRLIGIGLMLVCLLSLSMFALSRRIVKPLEEFSKKLNGLETRHWRFKRTIFTGNELEIVDRAAADLTARLRESYDHLEDIVRVRTQALQKQTAQDAAILENIDYGLLMTDAKGKIVYMNKTGELLTGWTAPEILQKNIVDILPIIDEKNRTLDPEAHPVHLVLQSGNRWNPVGEPSYSFVRRDKKMTALHLRVTPIQQGKQCLGAIAVFRDITEERRIDRVKSEFISLVSHQLRTPLSSMRWYLEMLLGTESGTLNVDQREYAEEIEGSNARMVRLVNALLNVSRLELGTTKLNTETVDLKTLLLQVTDSLKLELKRRHMNVKVESDGITAALRTDRSLLQLILENLVSNAIKYGKEGTAVRVRIELDAQRSTASVTVVDDGIGIPASEQTQIFQKMFRATNAHMSETDGNGLGLYISHIAADTIGAKLSFESREDKGTSFTVEVPIEKK